uniref:NADH dehydrogenase subunit 6 n=1 Tax=Sophonia linealis TaxID=2038641 RepID=A0A343K803_9HEMI|nr:NADH dehydrogenase subunit 6 [Sophonia linealis]
MKFFLMKLMMILSSMTPFLFNPMSLGLILLMQTFMTIMLMNKMSLSSWFSMITFLMMIGGLLIIFTYMSSISSNEMFSLNMKLIFTLILATLISEELLLEYQTNESEEMMNVMLMNQELISMLKLYNKKSLAITMMLVLYLLFTMIVVSTIVKHNQGPLRPKMYE